MSHHDELSDQNIPTSYGIIAVCKTNKIHYLITKRRDSIEYLNVLRGLAGNHLYNYVQYMMEEERERLQAYSFADLWNDLWVNHKSWFYRNEYAYASHYFQEHFTYIKQAIVDKPIWQNQSEGRLWGFPKGRQKKNETPWNCAFREFQEETKIKTAHTFTPLFQISELFQGTDHNYYRSSYIICKTDFFELPVAPVAYDIPRIRPPTISEEVSEMHWHPMADVKDLFEPYRKPFLNNLHNQVLSHFL